MQTFKSKEMEEERRRWGLGPFRAPYDALHLTIGFCPQRAFFSRYLEKFKVEEVVKVKGFILYSTVHTNFNCVKPHSFGFSWVLYRLGLLAKIVKLPPRIHTIWKVKLCLVGQVVILEVRLGSLNDAVCQFSCFYLPFGGSYPQCLQRVLQGV